MLDHGLVILVLVLTFVFVILLDSDHDRRFLASLNARAKTNSQPQCQKLDFPWYATWRLLWPSMTLVILAFLLEPKDGSPNFALLVTGVLGSLAFLASKVRAYNAAYRSQDNP